MSKAWIMKMLLLLQVLLLIQHSVDSASVVKYLPGFEGPLPFHLETGYIGVGEGEKIQLFYYFIKSEKNPKEDPLMIFLTGGPGCTALSALAYEIGPFAFKIEDYNGSLPSLISTSYSWTKEASIIFLDQPVGTGFSYSTTPLSYKPSDTREAKQTYEFLQKWLVEHSEFVSNPFYVGGDSYSGITVPAIVQQISIGYTQPFKDPFSHLSGFDFNQLLYYYYTGNELDNKPLINLKGYILGNPVTDHETDNNHLIPYVHRMGLISDELYESLQRSCEGNYVRVDPTNTQCLILMEDYNKCVSRIYDGHILLPFCDLESPNPFSTRDHSELVHSDHSLPISDCYMHKYLLATHWANNEDVRNAFHVVEGSIEKWVKCNWDVAYEKDIRSSVPYHLNISKKGIYRSLVYSGDHDMVVPFIGTQAWINSLNYAIIDKWRPWFVNNQIIGYTRTYANNMTFVTIKGGGHTVEYTPQEGFMMFQKWIRSQSL